VNGRHEVDALLQRVKDDHPGATHYCYAYRIVSASGTEIDEFSTDAGEPLGSAGAPLLGALRRLELVNRAVVTARFYGGTKLGIPGLIEAYSHGANEALASVAIGEWTPMLRWQLKVPYPQVERVKGSVSKMGGTIVSATYDDGAELLVHLPKEREAAFRALTAEWAGAGVEVEVIEG